MVDGLEGYRPNVGLENVGRFDRQPLELPTRRQAQLTGEPIPRALDALFPRDSVEGVLRQFVSPEVHDPSILLPLRFDSLIRGATAELRSHAEQSDSAVLRSASDVLERHQDLRDLLSRNRSALLAI